MNTKKVKIKQMVSTDIFENDKVKERLDVLFKDFDTGLRCRYGEIRSFVLKYVKKDFMNLTYEDTIIKFKLYLYKQLLNEAVEILFSQNSEFDIRKIITSILTEDRMYRAIYGEPMTYVFADFVRNLQKEAFIEGNKKDEIRIAIERKYSPRSSLRQIKAIVKLLL